MTRPKGNRKKNSDCEKTKEAERERCGGLEKDLETKKEKGKTEMGGGGVRGRRSTA